MKTKWAYTFKGVALNFGVPVNEKNKHLDGHVNIDGDISVHSEMEGSWIDTLVFAWAVNKLIKLLKELSK